MKFIAALFVLSLFVPQTLQSGIKHLTSNVLYTASQVLSK